MNEFSLWNDIKRWFSGDKFEALVVFFIAILFCLFLWFLSVQPPAKSYSIKVIDGCEYIVSGNNIYTHKANCKGNH